MIKYMRSRCLSLCKGGWTSPEIAGSKLKHILDNYSKAYLVLIDGNNEVVFDIVKSIGKFMSHNETVNQLISRANYQNLSLGYEERIPDNRLGPATYSDVYQAGYQIRTEDLSNPDNKRTCRALREGLVLFSDIKNVWSRSVHKNVLVTIRGVIHRHQPRDTDIIVPHGGHAISMNNASAGLISFYKLGGIETMDIETYIYSGGLIKIKHPFDPKRTPVLVLGGFMVPVCKGIFWRSDDETMSLNIAAIPHAERMACIERLLGESAIGSHFEKECFKRDYLFSAEFVEKVMSSHLTFMGSVGCSLVTFTTKPVNKCRIPGLIVLDRESILPLMSGIGRVIEYWSQSVDGYWHVSTKDEAHLEYVMDGEVSRSKGSARLSSGMTHHRSNAGFLSIEGFA